MCSFKVKLLELEKREYIKKEVNKWKRQGLFKSFDEGSVNYSVLQLTGFQRPGGKSGVPLNFPL